jgi:hypothetical protein
MPRKTNTLVGYIYSGTRNIVPDSISGPTKTGGPPEAEASEAEAIFADAVIGHIPHQ